MKKALFAAGLAVFAAGLAAAKLEYAGSKACALCHKTEKQGQQVVIWQDNKHSKSFATLKTEAAALTAEAMGVGRPDAEAACLKCHAPLHATAPALKAEGVTCEACHGPGSEYKKLPLMRDPAEAAKFGLLLYPTVESRQALCLPCHENAHGLSFDFEAAWAKIKHPVPGR